MALEMPVLVKPTLCRSVFALFGRVADASANRVEIHIHQAGQDRGRIGEFDTAKSTLPESPGEILLGIRSSGHAFGDHFHEPANMAQPRTQFLDPVGVIHDGLDLLLRGWFGAAIGLLAERTQHPPASGDLFVRPGGHDIGPVAEDDMEVTAQHGKADDVNPELGGQEFQPMLDPDFSMFEVLAGQRIDAAQEAPAHTAIDAVEDGNLVRTKLIRASDSGHA